MKRYYATLAFLTCSVLLAMLWAATPLTAQTKVTLRASGGPTGTGKDLRIQMVAEAVRRGNPDWTVDTINGPTTVAEITMMARGQLNFTTIDAASMPSIARGSYGGIKLPKPVHLRWLLPSTAMTNVLYMTANMSINSYADIKNKKLPIKFSMGRKGTDPYNIITKVLKAYGFSPEDIIKWGGKRQNAGSDRAAQLIADGLLEVFIHAGVYPAVPITELERTRKIKAVFIREPDIQAKLKAEKFIKVPIAAGSYTFVKEKTSTMAMPTMVAVLAEMPGDIAYNFTRAVWEQREKFLYPLHKIFRTYLHPDVVSSWAAEYRDLLH
ncbi:MAG: TAXI family TRAP transporter solute-binding subunit, partial [Desulfobacterales bacterium]|nr:TAXI family TRAP transporter solute-binding subunit [Desulfobacterales bacterium]